MSQGRAVRGGPARVLPTKALRREGADQWAGDTPAAVRVEAIAGMDREALLVLWASTMNGEPPPRLSQPFLRHILSFELQAQEHGGLPTAVTRKLESLAVAQASGKEKPATSPKLKSGGRLLREWGGVTHVVDVVEGGFLWRGERHRSLSAIARAITGAHWSGPRFFGLQESAGKARSAGAAEGRTRQDGTEGAHRVGAASGPPGRKLGGAAGRASRAAAPTGSSRRRTAA